MLLRKVGPVHESLARAARAPEPGLWANELWQIRYSVFNQDFVRNRSLVSPLLEGERSMSEAHISENQGVDPAKTILVVEDEALIRAVLSDMLQDKGFKVLEAANANEAIEIIEKTTFEIDLVFTDVRMPGSMDGFGLVRWIQNSRPSVPVIVASGDIGKFNDASCMTLGDMLIPKPYDLERTAMKIRKALESRSR